MRRMLDVDIPGKGRRGRPNLRWKDACKRDMTQAGLKEDNATKRAEWRKKLISYTGDPKWQEQYTISLCITFIEQVLNDMLITGNVQQRCRQSQLLTDHVTVNLHYNILVLWGILGNTPMDSNGQMLWCDKGSFNSCGSVKVQADVQAIE